MKNLLKILILLNLFIFLAISPVFAGDTGKIIGRITDEKNEPVVGATVLVVGTTRGAASDPDGKFTVIGVPIGTYSIRATAVGFKPVLIKDVKVTPDQTTQLDFKMDSDVLNQKEVVIQGSTLVNSMTVSNTKEIGKDAIENTTAAKTVEDVIKTQAGVVKKGGNLYLRGGRPNEVQYVIDGVPVNNVVGNAGEVVGVNKDIANIYAGNSGSIGGGGIAISSNAIASINVQTSGFDADYGNAQSGIVSVTTKSGSEKYSVGLQYRTDRLAATNENENYESFTFGGPEPLTKYLLPSLGVKIPGTIGFFVSADINRKDGAVTYADNEFYNPVGRKIVLDGFLGGIMNGLGFNFYDNQTNSFTFNSKIKYDIDWKDQVSYSYRASLSTAHNFSNGWKYLADSSALSEKLSTQHVVAWTHFFNEKSLIKVNLSRLQLIDKNDLAGLTPDQYPQVINESPSGNDFDVDGNGFNDFGSSQRWYKADSRQWNFRLDYNGQVHPLHTLKTGFEVTYEELSSTEILNPTRALQYSDNLYYQAPYPHFLVEYYMNRGLNLGENKGEYSGYGTSRWVMQNYPNRGALYIQDNIEFQGLNLHVGLRYDYFDKGRQIFYDDYINNYVLNTRGSVAYYPEWVLAQGTDENGIPNNGRFLDDLPRFWYYFTHGKFTPRLAIGYPVTDRIVFYFNYGYFLQYPDRDHYYRELFSGLSGDWAGNPNLEPQKTIAYEAGFEDQFTDDMSFAVHAFYKDNFAYSTLVKAVSDLKTYENTEYGSTRGFEITANQAFTSNLSSTVTYSYQVAKGISSDPTASVVKNLNLPRETRLDFDQTHTLNLFMVYKVGYNEEGTFFGLFPFNNYSCSFTWSYGSGYPYTPYIGGNSASLENQYLHNDATLPYSSNIDLSFSKGILLFGKLNTSVTLEIINLLNRRNVTSGDGGSGFNSYAGRPYAFGDYDPSSGFIYRYNGMESRVPAIIFSAPRQILLGIKINLD